MERKNIILGNKRLITEQDVEAPNQIIEEYYYNKLAEITNIDERLSARHLIEDGLIFEEENRRISLYEGQILKTYGVSSSLLNLLLDTHLLRSEPSLRGGFIFELSHDTLVEPVLKAKALRLEVEKLEKEEKKHIEQEQKIELLRLKADEEQKLRELAQNSEKKAQRRFQLT